MNLYPIKFKEIFKQYIWGGEGFDKLNKTAPDNFVAESWEVSCRKEGISVVENGSLMGKTLKELIEEYKHDLIGINSYNEDMDFPLLVKFINARKKLSVQVHPDDVYALAHEGEPGKNEAWIILSAEENAELIIGLKERISKEEFIKAVDRNEVENCLNKIKVLPGDVINIPAGLIHAIGEGIVLTEIQQNSNTTYRVYDYNRKDSEGKARPLHIDKAYDVIDFTGKHRNCVAKGLRIKVGDAGTRRISVVNRYFCVETFDLKGTGNQKADGTSFLIYIFTDGRGVIRSSKEDIFVKTGDTYLIPASLGEFVIEGDVKFIKSYVPDIKKDIISPLIEVGYTIRQIKYNIAGIEL